MMYCTCTSDRNTNNFLTLADDDHALFWCRLLDVMGNRLVDIFSLEKPVSEMVSQKVYRIEVSVWGV